MLLQGCGVVTYETEEAAQNAIATLNDTELGGRMIFVREDRESQPTSAVKPKRGFRVYVGNLSWNVMWQELKDHMKKAGTVVHADGEDSMAVAVLCAFWSWRLTDCGAYLSTVISAGGG